MLDVDQLNQILGILGTPDEETLCRVGSERVSSISQFIVCIYSLYTFFFFVGSSLYP